MKVSRLARGNRDGYHRLDVCGITGTSTGEVTGVTIALPAMAPDPISSTVVLKVKGTLDINQPPASPPAEKKPARKSGEGQAK